jgi:hypothetical protein
VLAVNGNMRRVNPAKNLSLYPYSGRKDTKEQHKRNCSVDGYDINDM